MKSGDHLFLVDGSGYIFRAYHALPPLTRKSDGLPVGAVSGFCNMLWKLLSDARDTSVGVTPTHLAVIFDYSSKTFRNELYSDYKANRTAPPEDLIPQFGLIRQATRAFNLPCIEKEGYEADDLIATYARAAEAAGADVTIVSSDKDLMQLVTDRVSMYDSMKDRQIAIPDVVEKWGVPPESMIDLQALTGDSTDNVPGIPGIGPKTAAQLLAEYGDLDTLLERASEIRQTKRRENLIAHADMARLSRELVTLKTDVPLDLDLDSLVLEPQDGPKLVAFLKGLEFNSLTRRVAEATGTDAAEVEAAVVGTEQGAAAHGPDLDVGDAGGAAAPAPEAALPPGDRDAMWLPSELAAARAEAASTGRIDHGAYTCVRDLAALQAWIDQAREAGVVAFDTETNSLDAMQADLVGFSLAIADNAHDASGTGILAAYVPLGHRKGIDDLLGGGPVEGQVPAAAALALLKPLLEDESVLKVAQNLKYDWLVMMRHGIEIVGFDDTMLMSYVLDAGKGNHGMDALSERWLGHRPIAYKEVCGSGKSAITFDLVDLDKATAYAAEDADVTLRLWLALKPRLVAEGLVPVYERLERPLVPVLARMEERGISIDRQILSRLSGELAQGAAALEAGIQELAGESFNIGSPQAARRHPLWQDGPAGRSQDEGRAVVDLRPGAGGPRRGRPRTAAQDRRLAPGDEAEVDLYGRAAGLHPSTDRAGPHLLRACRDHHRPAFLLGTEPAEHPGAHAGGAQDPHRLRRGPGQQARFGRLQPDRAARARPRRRNPATRPGVRGGDRHPRDDCLGDVQSTGGGHAAGSAPAGQGDQFRHHLRHLRFRPRQPARHRALGGGRIHQASISSASRGSATIWRRPRPLRASTAMSRRYSGAGRIIQRSDRRTRRCAPSTSAPLSMRRSRGRPPISSAGP